jgi:hypothetical protein
MLDTADTIGIIEHKHILTEGVVVANNKYQNQWKEHVLDMVVSEMGSPPTLSSDSRANNVFGQFWRVDVWVKVPLYEEEHEPLVNKMPKYHSWLVKLNEDGTIESRTHSNGQVIPIKRIY